jgi:peptidoglycan/xylan/chitin deacetylase (PgdA/CDA1 family)
MKGSVSRRHFLSNGIRICTAAGTLGISGTEALAQTVEGSVRRPGRFDENAIITEHEQFTWPGGKTLAVWFIPNVEVFILSPSGGAQGDVDVLNYSWREYGMRVGLWRLADVMDEAGIKATVALNAGVCDVWPKAIEEMDRRGWEMMGHNLTNSRSLRNLPLDQEQTIIRTTLQIIEQATGKKVRGWLGTGLGETFTTLDNLAEAGVVYTGDWNNDDIPYRMKVRSGEMYALNYGNAINDISFWGKGHTGDEYYQMLVSQFDTLYEDSKKLPRVMGIPLHPFHTGQPSRIKYFQKAVQYMKRQDNVWFARGSEILDAYKKSQA